MNFSDNMEAIWIIRWAFFAIYTACYAVIFYATWRQYSLYKRTTEIPAKYANLVSNEQFKKERRNEMEKLRFDMLFLALRWLLLIPFLFFGLLFFLWTSSKNLCHFFGFENEYFYSIMFVWLVHTLQMPLNLFNTLFNELIIQRKYKESNEEMENGNVEKTSKCFSVLKILGKQFLIYTICIPLGVCAFLAAVRFFGPNNFWLVAFISLNIGLYATLFFMDYLMPFIFPKQYGQLPMHECELKKNIEKLCAQENVKISGVFISKKANTEVAFMGYWTWSTRKKLVLDEIFLDIGFLKKVYEFNGKKYDEENDGTVEEGNTKINGKEKETNVAINDANTKEENTVAPLLPQIVNENEEKIKKINEKNVENKNKIEETDEEFVLNDEEIMGMVAAEIGLYKLKTGIRDRIIHRINHLCLELLPLLIFQFTYQSEMIFSAFHVPPTEYYPPIVGSWFAISLFVWPAFELYSGILTFRRVFMEDHVRAKSAIQLGYGKEYRAGLVKFWTEIGIELGDWLYRLLQRGQWERMPTDLDELDKILAAKEEL